VYAQSDSNQLVYDQSCFQHIGGPTVMKTLHPNDAKSIMEKYDFDGVIIYGYVRTDADPTQVNTVYSTYGKSDQDAGDSALIGKMLHSVWTCAANTKDEAVAVGKKVKEQFKLRLLAED